MSRTCHLWQKRMIGLACENRASFLPVLNRSQPTVLPAKCNRFAMGGGQRPGVAQLGGGYYCATPGEAMQLPFPFDVDSRLFRGENEALCGLFLTPHNP